MENNYEISYWTNSADEFYPTLFQIDPYFESTLYIRTNRDDPSFNSVGKSSLHLAESQIYPLLEILMSKNFASIEVLNKAVPGEIVRTIGLKTDLNDELNKSMCETSLESASFLKAESLIHNIIKEVKKHPKSSISIDVRNLPSQIENGEQIHVYLTIANIGESSIKLIDPFIGLENSTSFTLISYENLASAEGLIRQNHRFTKLTMDFIRNHFEPDIPDDFYLLKPDDAKTFEFVVTIDWMPGNYSYQFSLESKFIDEAQKFSCDFEMLSQMYEIEVL